MSSNKRRGFTLIELLVVISIIGILTSGVMASLSTARAKSRDAKRMSDLSTLRLALERYADDFGTYPVSGGWRGNCSGFGGYGTTGSGGWVPNIAPIYVPILPLDPKPGNSSQCYLYNSNGTDFMLLAYQTVETYAASVNPMKRPGVPSESSFAVYTPGASTW